MKNRIAKYLHKNGRLLIKHYVLSVNLPFISKAYFFCSGNLTNRVIGRIHANPIRIVNTVVLFFRTNVLNTQNKIVITTTIKNLITNLFFIKEYINKVLN